MSLNPPPEKSAATSGIWIVPPTAVTLCAAPERQLRYIRDIKDTGLQWAARRETGYEFRPLLAVVRETRMRRRVGVTISNTTISRAEQQGSTACAYLRPL
jgi:hypothetical protein